LEKAAPASQYLARIRGELGDLLRLQHRHAAAVREIDAATTKFTAVLNSAGSESNPILPVLQAQLSEAELDAGDPVKAQATATRALASGRSALPPHNYRLGSPLFALARAELALGHATNAESLLREALAVRSPPHPSTDPRVLEVKVALINALEAQHRQDEADDLRAGIEPLLAASKSPYAVDLRARLAAR
jgi:serine/threonine-protein kinase